MSGDDLARALAQIRQQIAGDNQTVALLVEEAQALYDALSPPPAGQVDERVREASQALRDYMSNMKLMTSGERELFTNCANLVESLAARLAEADAAHSFHNSGDASVSIADGNRWTTEAIARHKAARTSRAGTTGERM